MSGAAVIEVVELRKRFRARGGAVEAVAGLSFCARRGEILGLLGPNGAGKTTTMRMLTTLLPIDAGSVLIAGVDVRAKPAEVRRRIGYVSQLGGAERLATGRESLALQAALYGLRGPRLKQRVDLLLDELELAPFADRRVGTYSGGQRRRLDVALGIVHEPEVVFLDEPSTGLDPQSRARLWEHVRALARSGATIVVTTHYLEEADALCDRVLIIDQGRIVAAGSPAELKGAVSGARVQMRLASTPAEGAALEARLGAIAGVHDAAFAEGQLTLRLEAGALALPAVIAAAAEAGLEVSSLAFSEPSLDDVFMRATGRSLREGERRGGGG